MKFELRNTSFGYPDGTGDIWAENVILEPRPLQKPQPPILIGGVGPKLTLRIIAELGDACNLWGPPEEFVKQRETLNVTAKKLAGTRVLQRK